MSPKSSIPQAAKSVSQVLMSDNHQVEAYAQAVGRALHLSIVSVVIVEMMIPSIYSSLLPWADPDAAQGVGGYVIRLHGSAGSVEVVGFVWALFIFDLVASFVVGAALWRKYLQYYRRAQ